MLSRARYEKTPDKGRVPYKYLAQLPKATRRTPQNRPVNCENKHVFLVFFIAISYITLQTKLTTSYNVNVTYNLHYETLFTIC